VQGRYEHAAGDLAGRSSSLLESRSGGAARAMLTFRAVSPSGRPSGFSQTLTRIVGADPRAWAAWAAFALLAVLVKLNAAPTLGNVFEVYRDAALRWQGGEDLYPPQFHFNYFPPSAAFFVPWTWLPFPLAGALWRILNIAVFALGVWRISTCDETPVPRSRFLIVSLVTLLLSGSAAQYGQLTLAMAGLMMLAVADIQRDVAWRAATFAVVATALKPLAIVLVLVVIAVYPRLLWRIAIAMGACFLSPFLLQHPDYVLRQYAAVPAMLVARAGQPFLREHLFGLCATLGWVATPSEQALVRAAGAFLVLGLCWRARRHVPSVGLAVALYGLTTCYILLLGSATEANTYAMMAPVIGLLAATAWYSNDRWLLASAAVMTTATLMSHALTHAFPHTALTMVKPAVCAALFAIVSHLSMRSHPAASSAPGGAAAGSGASPPR
jgi:hypothetical protein